MPRLAFALLFSATVLLGRAQTPSPATPLVGHIEGDTYAAPSGAYQVKIPVRAEMGGTISDTNNVVTFRDDFNVLYSIAAFRMDSAERWKLSLALRGDATAVVGPKESGPKDYLYGFFGEYVLPDFRRAFPGAQVEKTVSYLPKLFDGSLIVYTFLPGGSMFASKMTFLDPGHPPPVAKRGNMLFVKNGYVFVISTELAERVTEGSAYALTPAQEDVRLREKLTDIIGKMKFPPVPAAP